MNKFNTNQFAEESAAAAAYDAQREYHAWLDAQEADDLLSLEATNEILDEIEVSEEDLARGQAEWEAACDQGHDWDDYDDPVDLYGAEWENYSIREWD